MKKILLSVLLLLICIPTFAQEIKITLDGNEVKSDVSAFIKNDRTLLPIRFISEKLGYDVKWDEAQRKVSISNSNNLIEMTIDSTKLNVNGQVNNMDVAPIIKDDRTFVPLRFVAQYMGLGVDWDAKTYTVILTSNSDSKYISEISALLSNLNSKTEELKKYFYEDASKYNRAEIEAKFDNLISEINTIISQVKSVNVPVENATSYKFILESTDILNQILNVYKPAILDANKDKATELIKLQSALAVKLHEASQSINAERKGEVYTPDLNTQIYNRAGELDTSNLLEDEILKNLIKQI